MIRKAALITNDVVSAVILVESDNPPKDIINQFVLIPDGQAVQVGHRYTAGVFLPPLIDYAAIGERKRDEVNGERKRRLNNLTATLGDISYDGDEESVRNLTSILTASNAGVPIPWPISWRDANNTVQALQHEDAVTLAAMLMQQIQNIYAKSWHIKDVLIPAEVLAENIQNFEVSDDAHWGGA